MEHEEVRKIINLVYEILADDKTADVVATMYWKLFNKLKEKGFTEELAASIIQNFSANAKT